MSRRNGNSNATPSTSFTARSPSAQRPGHPGALGACKRNAPEHGGVQHRREHRGHQRRAPPGAVPQPVKHANVQPLRQQKCHARGHRNARWRQHQRRSHGHRKPHPCHAPGLLRPMGAVDQLAHQEGHGVGDGTPGQPVVDGELDQDVGCQHNHCHGQGCGDKLRHAGARQGHRGHAAPVPSRLRATASPTLMPSTPADKMPPA